VLTTELVKPLFGIDFWPILATLTVLKALLSWGSQLIKGVMLNSSFYFFGKDRFLLEELSDEASKVL
jgi:hypothetical protein